MGTTTATPSDTGRPPDESQNGPMILRMIDWRGCSAVEYVPGRKAGKPTFIGRRIPVRGLVEWLELGYSPEEFAADLDIAIDSVMAAVRYLHDDPPVEVVDLTGCPAVVCFTDEWGNFPAFEDTTISVESLFNALKGGQTVDEFISYFAAEFGPDYLDHEHIDTVLGHAAHGYPVPAHYVPTKYW